MNLPAWATELFWELFKNGAGAIFGAVAGAAIKGRFDKKKIDALTVELSKKIDETNRSHRDLALKEKALGEKEDELTGLRQKLDTRGVSVTAAEKQLDDLMTSLERFPLDVNQNSYRGFPRTRAIQFMSP